MLYIRLFIGLFVIIILSHPSHSQEFTPKNLQELQYQIVDLEIELNQLELKTFIKVKKNYQGTYNLPFDSSYVNQLIRSNPLLMEAEKNNRIAYKDYAAEYREVTKTLEITQDDYIDFHWRVYERNPRYAKVWDRYRITLLYRNALLLEHIAKDYKNRNECVPLDFIDKEDRKEIETFNPDIRRKKKKLALMKRRYERMKVY